MRAHDHAQRDSRADERGRLPVRLRTGAAGRLNLHCAEFGSAGGTFYSGRLKPATTYHRAPNTVRP